MSHAARELHITQSGVSQHIRSLEDFLKVRLFDRIQQRIVPTTLATKLYGETLGSMERLEAVLHDVRGGVESLSGVVRIGMPVEFGVNRLMPLLGELGREHPALRFEARLDFASTMNDLLLKGELDFAFVDEFPMDPRIQRRFVVDERLELVGLRDRFNIEKHSKHDRKYFEGLEYVDYQDGAPLLTRWMEFHYGKRAVRFNVRATVMDVQAVMRLITAGLGAAVIPSYLADSMEKSGAKLHRFRGSGKPLINKMSVAELEGRTQTFAAKATLKFLTEKLA